MYFNPVVLGRDFTFSASTLDHTNLTFSAGSNDMSMMCVNVSILDDDLLENTESFDVRLSAGGLSDTVGRDVNEYTIEDNDGELTN